VASTEKISVAIGREELRRAKTAAQEEGVSLSSFVTSALRERLAAKGRLEAAKKVLAAFEPEDLPTAAEERDLLAEWSSAKARPRRRATRRRSA
jgi:hypothetical protein